ncbi:aldo/keto reductase [Humitalea sp. 24SJ18S-53]|uniref:aldo/keto reductase n=1 Tax=Humitalea sp. 24SJ18S-53 TaxID=3422307 RepID=UPI003D66CD68
MAETCAIQRVALQKEQLARRGGDTFLLAGKQIARIGYGAALRVAGRPGTPDALSDLRTVQSLLRRAIELGVTLLDTADSYGPGLSEEVIAAALRPYPPGLLIATKGGVLRSGRDETRLSGDPARLRAACEASLRRLKLESIDLYQLHWRDPGVPFADQIGALADLMAEGKVRHLGLCNIDAVELAQATLITPIASVQCAFGLGTDNQAALLALCAAQGIAFIAHGPLSVLRQGGPVRQAALLAMARRLGSSPAQIALAWILHRAPHLIAIPGTLRHDHLEENLRAGVLRLSAADIAALDA